MSDIQETPRPERPKTDHDLLILIWERQGEQSRAIKGIQNTLAAQATAADERFVTKQEFAPYRLTLNLIGCAVVLAIVGAVLYLVVKGGPAGHAETPSFPPTTSALSSR